MSSVIIKVTDDPRDHPTVREAWDEWNRNVPESFWDVAVWPPRGPDGIEPSLVWPVSLDVGNRFQIWAHGYAAALRDSQ